MFALNRTTSHFGRTGLHLPRTLFVSNRTAFRALPGLFLTIAAVALAWSANQKWPTLSPLTAAVILGVLVANIAPANLLTRSQPGLKIAAKHLMRAGIVLLGLQLALGDVLRLGWQSLVLVVIVVFATFFGTQWLGHRMGLPGRQPLLIATGFAICGASAIAAMDSVTRRAGTSGDSRDKNSQHNQDDPDPDPVVAVALVTLCGSLAIAVLPLLQGPLGLSDLQFGHWVGASVHDVGQVVATASVAGPTALQPAVVVKLMRVAMLAPMVAGAALRERKKSAASPRTETTETTDTTEETKKTEPETTTTTGTGTAATTASTATTTTKNPPILPLFVISFLLMIALRTADILPPQTLTQAKQTQDLLLAAGMFALGSSVRVRELARTGIKPLLLGLASWLLIAAVAYIGVRVTT